MLLKAGFICRSGKGRHTKSLWESGAEELARLGCPASFMYALSTLAVLVIGNAATAQTGPHLSIASNLKNCQTSQLSVRHVDGAAALGHTGESYAFTNISSSPCTLYGYPGFVPLDADDRPLTGVEVTRSESNYMHHAQPHQLTLTPGAQASFVIVYVHFSSDGHSCPKSAKVEITPPNATDHFSLPEHLTPCGPISLTPVEAGIVYMDPSDSSP